MTLQWTSAMKIIVANPIEKERTLKERFLSFPWTPWIKTKWVQYPPDGEILMISSTGQYVMSPTTYKNYQDQRKALK